MSRIFHVWWLLIVVLIIGAIIVLYGMFNTSQSLSADTLYNAVRISAQYSRDDSGKESRGVFVINKDAFRKRLASYNIKDIGAIGAGTDKLGNTKMYIHYLIDNKDTDNKAGNHTRNGYVSEAQYKDYVKEHKYIPVRAIQVQAVVNNKDLNKEKGFAKNPNKITNVNSKYVATLVVQNQKAITTGKYNKEHKITNKTIKGLQRHNNDDASYSANDPIKHPNTSKRNSVDLSVNSYAKHGSRAGENGDSDNLDTSNNLG